MKILLKLIFSSLMMCLLAQCTSINTASPWLPIDDFEQPNAIKTWQKMDTDNQTTPFVDKPQVSEVRKELALNNHYLIKKPAAEGVIGNRKAITFKALPQVVELGETYTFYTRIKVEYFPNNHSFGLSNLSPSDIQENHYNSFEPMIRVTDKFESNGYKNDGTLMVMGDNKAYHNISHLTSQRPAKPLETQQWYELWYVINNAPHDEGGQSYDLYVRGGEFVEQEKAFEYAKFRMKRELPLLYFMTISNTGSIKKPYGNGGLMYDDIYMAKGIVLDTPR
ncbi:hypothetical protein [uncultured Paraglaciecola sp.]|uniref:hypothetical protein n=1 Tax=uncultured Paraglaciecola sp. TaxID=1765024 RepID=UPI002599CCD0|nr:hypothetical protein [uncultured Paraglaciecola sp.]